MKKALLFACLLAGMAFASAKSFTVTLFEPAMIGGTELKAGDYKFELQDQKIVIKHGHDTTEAAVKVETGDAKYRFHDRAVRQCRRQEQGRRDPGGRHEHEAGAELKAWVLGSGAGEPRTPGGRCYT